MTIEWINIHEALDAGICTDVLCLYVHIICTVIVYII